jgi:hypothetical protein
MSERNRSPFAEMHEFKTAVKELFDNMEKDPMSIRYAGPEEYAKAKKALASASNWLLGELFPANRHIPIMPKDT